MGLCHAKSLFSGQIQFLQRDSSSLPHLCHHSWKPKWIISFFLSLRFLQRRFKWSFTWWDFSLILGFPWRSCWVSPASPLTQRSSVQHQGVADGWSCYSRCAVPQRLLLRGRCMENQQSPLELGEWRQAKMVAVTQQAFLLVPVLTLKVKIYRPCRRSNAGLSSALSLTGGVTPGEKNHQENGFPGRRLSQPAGITNLSGNLFFMASEKVILLVTVQKDWLK